MNKLIHKLIYEGNKILSEARIKNPVNEARVIIKKTLKKTELDFIISPNQEISSNQKKLILHNLIQRARGRPVSKIFGLKEFFSNEFIVN